MTRNACNKIAPTIRTPAPQKASDKDNFSLSEGRSLEVISRAAIKGRSLEAISRAAIKGQFSEPLLLRLNQQSFWQCMCRVYHPPGCRQRSLRCLQDCVFSRKAASSAKLRQPLNGNVPSIQGINQRPDLRRAYLSGGFRQCMGRINDSRHQNERDRCHMTGTEQL